jgi:hypothetical protein
MKSAAGLILGFSILGTAVACDNAGDDTNGDDPIVIAGSANNAGSGSVPMAGSSNGGSGGGGELPAGVPLTATDGWVDGMSNALMIQGAMFEYADPTSLMGLTKDFTGTNACIKGTAAKVDMMSMACTTKMFTPPATDCYGEYWGAAIGLNLNQAIDETTMMGGTPMSYDATAIKGFAFNITGAMVPTSLRFKVEGPASAEFCTPKDKPVKLGANTFMFEDLIKECWAPKTGAATAATTKAEVVKIAWQVVTDAMKTIPFDYCVTELRALQ